MEGDCRYIGKSKLTADPLFGPHFATRCSE